jgi:hypothetical protein
VKLEANIKIKFLKINHFDLEKLPDNSQLRDSTENTVKILCEQIEKYFNDKKIKTKTEYILS